MSDDLVKRLRDLGDHAAFEPHMHHTAADRIEGLSNCVAVLEAKLLNSALQEISARGQASEAYQAQLEAEAKLATCEKYRDAYAECDRIGTQAVRDLEAKLARVTEAYRLEAMKRDDYSHDAFDKHIAELTSSEAATKEGGKDE